jgi:hypothetical protein
LVVDVSAYAEELARLASEAGSDPSITAGRRYISDLIDACGVRKVEIDRGLEALARALQASAHPEAADFVELMCDHIAEQRAELRAPPR